MTPLENPKHEAFCQGIAEGLSATSSYRENVAGNGTTTDSCMAQSCRLMADIKIRSRIAELRKEFGEVLEHSLGIRRETIARHLTAIITTPISEVHQAHEMCQEYSEVQTQHGTTIKCKMPSKLDALKELCKLAGWYAPEKIEHSGGIQGLLADLTGAKKP